MNGAHSIETPSLSAGQRAENAGFAFPWTPDLGNGRYQNPIIYADYSDPDIVRAGEDFYMVASSFNCTPGLPILHSKDLVNWKIVNHGVKNLPHPRYEQIQPGCGVWAPAIRFHAGKFWIFFPMPDEGIYFVTAKHPTDDWSEPHLLQPGKGLIDPCPLWDDDGNAYLVHAYAGSRAGIKHRLRVCPMAPDGSRLIGEGKIIFHEPEKHPTLEGPKFYKHDGWYYILAPAGGVETGWQLALRSRNIYGPYEDKILLAQGDSHINGPHQGGLVDTGRGDWWFVHFQDAEVYGRILHLQPVFWRDGWPMMGKMNGNGHGEPVLSFEIPSTNQRSLLTVPQTSDEFDSPKLGLQWQWHANYRDEWYSLSERPGWLRLFPQLGPTSLEKLPNLLLQKFPARSFMVQTQLEFSYQESGETAGLVVVGEEVVMFGVQREELETWLILCSRDKIERLCPLASQMAKLRVRVYDGGKFSFGFAENGEFVDVPKCFQASKGKWIGAKLGLCSLKEVDDARGGYVDFDYFRFM